MSNLNMPVKYCTDENGNPYSPVVYQESMFNDDASRMDPVPRKMFAKAYDPTKTYPTENLFCIQDNKYYKFTGSGTTTGTFDPTKWTETDDATELTALNSTLATKVKGSYNSTYDVTLFEADINGVKNALYAKSNGLIYYIGANKIWEMNTLAVDISTLFTSKSSLIDNFYAYKQGNMVYVQFRINISSTSPLNNRTQLAVVDTNIRPKLWVTADVKDDNGRNQNGGIWLERSTNKILYTGDNLTTSGSTKLFYVTFSYMIFD